ncbi:hypothetical protein WICPIJ_003248 [Wickerhamomyces pijperi]|uniref:DH domain-containing protein n=1 Tax=Wickerhamomyces pijperi TaxID=599730 RepID=A0A9P8Q9Y3_WICPI|nr:hypothetical protein WICPIJ_003248 [Wickerhamomyces pijperi]
MQGQTNREFTRDDLFSDIFGSRRPDSPHLDTVTSAYSATENNTQTINGYQSLDPSRSRSPNPQPVHQGLVNPTASGSHSTQTSYAPQHQYYPNSRIASPPAAHQAQQYGQFQQPQHTTRKAPPSQQNQQPQHSQPLTTQRSTTSLSSKYKALQPDSSDLQSNGPPSPKSEGFSQRTPLLQQGSSLLSRNSRNVSSPTVNQTSTFSNVPAIKTNLRQNSNVIVSPKTNGSGRAMSLNSFSSGSYQQFQQNPNLPSASKFHSKDSLKKTSGGRIIPQKLELSGSGGLVSKSKSLTKRISSSASLSSQRVSSSSSLASRTIVTTSARPPKVYPALLSRVATLFKQIIVTNQHNKDGLEYRDSFTGSQAVDAISYIIRTTDRNLALLLGRALDAQKFIHDVTYQHRLRDSDYEIYQFADVYLEEADEPSMNRNSSFSSEFPSAPGSPQITRPEKPIDHVYHDVNGVFTLLSECYSPTCTRDALCYSIACPRRLEQQARLNLKPRGGLKNDESSLYDDEEKKHLWSHTVSEDLLKSLDKKEIKRQELIYELIATERTFVKNLEYIRNHWIIPLRESNVIPSMEREKFIRTVFFNVIDILNVATRFRDALIKRQQVKPVVGHIGDIFLEFIPFFEPFVSYNGGQCFAKYELERQKSANPFFKRFVEETERLPASNRLNISSYLSQATTRTVRYNLLLKDIIKSTAEDSIDLPDLKKASAQILRLLERINIKVGKAEDRHALILLKQRLVFRPGEFFDLKLNAENRKILYTAPLKRKNQDKDSQGDIQVYLLDHVLVFVRVKLVGKREQHKVYQRPIPLPLLFISPTDELPSLRPYMRKAGAYARVLHTGSTSGGLIQNPSSNTLNTLTSDGRNPISFGYVGRRGYELTLYGTTSSAQESLTSIIEQQQTKLRTSNDIFTLTPLAGKVFDSNNRINCLVPFDGGRKILYGTDLGVFISDVKISTGENNKTVRNFSSPTRIISKVNVTQVEVLEEYQTLLALADKKLHAWPIDLIQTNIDKKTTSIPSTISKEIMSHVLFFKVGVCGGRMLVCAAKNDMIRVFEPTDPFSKKMSKKKFKNETKEFHFNSEPVSISFLKTRLIVGCTKGFEIVSLDGKSESILDPADTSLDFITNREGLKPLAIHRIATNFLLSYSDFSFYINKNGWRTRSDWIINWEGMPQNFSLWYPYLLAFEPNFIEIRNVDNGELLRVILGENIRLLHTGSQEILYAYEDERGYDVVASLDFWDKTNNSSNSSEKSKLSDIKEVDEKKV